MSRVPAGGRAVVRPWQAGTSAGLVLLAMVVAVLLGGSGRAAARTDIAAAAAQAAPVPYVALSPARLLDTRADGVTVDGVGERGVLGPGGVRRLPVAGRGGVPATGVGAVVLNVTAVGATTPTYLTVWPATSPRPLASNLNPADGRPKANLMTVKLGSDGAVAIFNAAGTVDVVADVAGYYASNGGFVATEPLRLADTRASEATVDGQGPKGAVGPGAVVTVAVAGRAGIPADATAVVANLTAVNASAPTYLTVWPSGTWMPLASNLNPADPAPIANLFTSALGGDGALSVLNAAGATDVVIDVAGYFTAGGGYHAVDPSRIVDTRPGGLIADPGRWGDLAGQGPIGPERELIVRVAGRAGIPQSGVGAVIVNITATDAGGQTFLTAWPTGTARPWASALNPLDTAPVASLAIVKVGFAGSISIYNAAHSTNVIVDVVGWVPAVPGEVLVAGDLTGGEVHVPALDAGERARYGLTIAAGEAFSVAAEPFPVGGFGLRCGASITVRRPDLSVAAQAVIGCPGGPDRSLDVDVVADRSGTWLVDVGTDLDRTWPTARVVLSHPIDGGALGLNTRATVPPLAMGQDIAYRVTPTPGQPLSVSVRPSYAGVLDECDVRLAVYRPNGALHAQAQAQPADCVGSFGLPTSIGVDITAAEAGAYRIVVDNGGPVARSDTTVLAIQPIDLGVRSMPAQLQVPIAAGQSVRWALPLQAGTSVNFRTEAGFRQGCATYVLRRPDGSEELTRQLCSPGFGAFSVDHRVDIGTSGNWTITFTNGGSIDSAVTGTYVGDLIGAAIPSGGVDDPVPALLPGQRYLRPIALIAGQRVTTVASLTASGPFVPVGSVAPDGRTFAPAWTYPTPSLGAIEADQSGTWYVLISNPLPQATAGGGTLTVTLPRDGGTLGVDQAGTIPTLRAGEAISFRIPLQARSAYTTDHTIGPGGYATPSIDGPDGSVGTGGPLLATSAGTYTITLHNGPTASAVGSIIVHSSVEAGTLSPGVVASSPALPANRAVVWRVPAAAGQTVNLAADWSIGNGVLMWPAGEEPSFGGGRLLPISNTGTLLVIGQSYDTPLASGAYHVVHGTVQDVAATNPVTVVAPLAPGDAVRITRPGAFHGAIDVTSDGPQVVEVGGALFGHPPTFAVVDEPTATVVVLRNTGMTTTAEVSVRFTPL